MSAMTVGDKVSAKVVLVKPEAEYCVVHLDGHKGVLGFVPNCDYNVQHGNAKKSFEQGETFTATVVSCPSPGAGGRLLLHTPLVDTKKTSHKGGAAKGSKAPPGSVVNGTVAHVHSGYAEVTVDGVKGRLNASEVQEMDIHTSPVRSASTSWSDLWFWLFFFAEALRCKVMVWLHSSASCSCRSPSGGSCCMSPHDLSFICLADRSARKAPAGVAT